jgi:hypothetical protein
VVFRKLLSRKQTWPWASWVLKETTVASSFMYVYNQTLVCFHNKENLLHGPDVYTTFLLSTPN